MADGREVLAALDGGVSCRRVGAWRLLDVFHLHFFVMDPQVRGPEVLLAALPFANAVGGPFPTEQNQEADVSTLFDGFSSLSLFFLLSQFKSEARERKQKRSQEEPREIQALAAWPGGLSSPSLEPRRLPETRRGLPGARRPARERLTPASPRRASARGDGGLDGAICRSSEPGIRYPTATSV